jgi:hypothetical protein
MDVISIGPNSIKNKMISFTNFYAQILEKYYPIMIDK